MKNTKLTAAATFEGLCDRFEVYATGIEKLAAAVEDGTVDAILQECADTMYDGNMKPVRAQFGRVISSQKSNAAKRGINTLIDVRRKEAIDLLEAYHKKALGARAAGTPRAGFHYTKEEVDALVAAGDVAELQRFYDNIHSNVGKTLGGLSTTCYTEALANNPKLARWVEVKAYVSEKLSALKASKRAAAATVAPAPTKPEISEELTNKLASYKAGKKVVFSPEQMEELLKLLS